MNVTNIYMQRDTRRALRRERLYRDVSNPLEVYDEVEIKNLFHFERVHIISITEDVNEDLQPVTGRSLALAPLQQVFIAPRFSATGCMQLSLAAWINVHQSPVCREVWAITGALLQTEHDSFRIVGSNKIGFYHKFNLPNIVGCINCMHIRINAPPIYRHPEEYINRKRYHSINVQAISDTDCIFTDLDVSWPASVHDSRIFKISVLYIYF